MIQFTLDAVERRAKELGICHVSDIRLVIGELRGAVPEQMEIAFHLLTSADQARGLFSGARLDIEYRPVLLRCRACGHPFPSTLEAYAKAVCPRCESASHEILSGDELLIDSFCGE
ncbi:MAG: hydrogenase maturation nickel metallochaperone HypA [Firmicutes bacterium]|nr:hydrogenase maturation nickel metallochaperone HypA [Bacillota bacterium]